jgi:hypothetical protein
LRSAETVVYAMILGSTSKYSLINISTLDVFVYLHLPTSYIIVSSSAAASALPKNSNNLEPYDLHCGPCQQNDSPRDENCSVLGQLWCQIFLCINQCCALAMIAFISYFSELQLLFLRPFDRRAHGFTLWSGPILSLLTEIGSGLCLSSKKALS